VNEKNRRGFTPLHLAISTSQFGTALRLLEAGARIDEKEWRNNRPFDLFVNDVQKRNFFLQSDFTISSLSCNHFDLWFYLVQLSDVVGIDEKVSDTLLYYVLCYNSCM
jgi:ankyrin repeat protein